MIISQGTLRAVHTGFRTQFMEAYHGIADPFHQVVGNITESDSAEEEYHWLGAVPGLRELLGEVQLKNLARHEFTIRNREWEDTIGVKRVDIERDRIGVYNPMIRAIGEAARMHPDELCADLLVNGFTRKCYTGKNFFDADHEPQAGQKKFSNKTTKKLSVANFRAARQSLRSRVNAEGRSMRLGRRFMLVVGPANEGLGLEITQAEKVGNGNTNVDKGTAELKVWPEIGALNEDAWFLLEVGQPVKPLTVQFEQRPRPVMVTNVDDSYVVLHQKFLWQVYARHNAGYALPELAYGSDGSTAA